MIHTPLMPHQKKALDFLLRANGGALFLPLGMGKSLVALAFCHAVNARRILITSDKNNIVNNWPGQIYQHTNWECYTRIGRGDLDDAYLRHQVSNENPFVVLANYDLIAHRVDDYKFPWDVWIGDESSEFKDQRTDRHTALRRVTNNASARIILNGKAVTERIEDLFGQYLMLDGGRSIGRSITQFRNRYMQPSPDGYGFCAQRSAFTRVRKDTEHITYWMDPDDSIKMPKAKYHRVYVDMPDTIRKTDSDLRDEYGATLHTGEKIRVTHAVSVFIKRHQLCGGVFSPADLYDNTPPGEAVILGSPKADIVRKIIIQNPEAKIVIWHQYIMETVYLKAMLSPLMETLGRKLYSMAEGLDSFAADTNSAVLLIRNSMCKGINQLSDVDISVFYSNPFSYQKRSQAEGRARRLTSTKPETHYFDIIVRNSIDEVVYNMLAHKKDVSLTFKQVIGMMETCDKKI